MKLANVSKIVNLTPHALHVWTSHAGEVVTIPVSGVVARVDVTRIPSQELYADPVPEDALDGIRISVSEVGQLYFADLKGEKVTWYPEEDTLYVVSGLVRTYYDRPYFVSPGDQVRDSDGKIAGYRGLDRGKWVES